MTKNNWIIIGLIFSVCVILGQVFDTSVFPNDNNTYKMIGLCVGMLVMALFYFKSRK